MIFAIEERLPDVRRVRGFDYARNASGQIVVRETERIDEVRYAVVYWGPCLCERLRAMGVSIMCFMCSGPMLIEVFSWTSGDL